MVGSGRCGTQSVAKFMNIPHEPNRDPVTYLAPAYSHGWMNAAAVRILLKQQEWPASFSDYKQSELIELTSQIWDDVMFMWLVRNPADTVASMVANNWYHPNDDNQPFAYMKIYQNFGDAGAQTRTFTNYPGLRTRGDYVGDFTMNEWRQMSQVERCGWWWNWVNARIRNQVQGLNVVVVKLEEAVKMGDRFGLAVGGTRRALPKSNTSNTTPVTGWEEQAKPMADFFGY